MTATAGEVLRLRAANTGTLLLRLGALAMILAYHVRPKVLHFDAEMGEFPDPLGVGHATSFALSLFSEGFCALLVGVGALTRLASIPVVFTMAMVLVLGARGFAGADVQLALLYALPYVTLAFVGPGSYSVDAHLAKRYDSVLARLRALLLARS